MCRTDMAAYSQAKSSALTVSASERGSQARQAKRACDRDECDKY